MSDPTIADWLGVGANLITTFAVAAGVLIAWRQLEAWKGEHVSKRRAEIAEQLLSAAYEVRSGLHATRSPMEFVSQDEGGRQDATIKVKWERLRSYAEYFDRLRTAQVLQEAFWDSEKISASVKELFDARATVLAAMHVLINLEFRENSSNEESDFYHELMRDMGAVHSKNDTLRSKIDEAVETLKGELLPVIRMDRKVK